MEVVDDPFAGVMGVMDPCVFASVFAGTGVSGGFGFGFASPIIPLADSIESSSESNCPSALLFSG